MRVDIKAKRYGMSEPNDESQAESQADGWVLDAISFSLNAGESLAITGPSGVGKSTLLRIVVGLDTEFEGSVERPERTGMVFQEPNLLPWRKVLANLTLVHPSVSVAEAQAMLAKVGLADKAHDWPQQLSLGQQRRLSLARAFLGQPQCLVMDEPFVSLDEATHADMIHLTQQLMSDSGAAVLLVTHDAQEADALTQRRCELRGAPARLYDLV